MKVVYSTLVPPRKPKAQLPRDNVPKNILLFYSIFKSEASENTHESQQKDSVDQENEIDFFWYKKFIS